MRNFNRASLSWTKKDFMPIFDEAAAKIKDGLELGWETTDPQNAIGDLKKLSAFFDVILLKSPSVLLNEVADSVLLLQDNDFKDSLSRTDEESSEKNKEKKDQIHAALIAALIQFPYLIEYLHSGKKDIPLLALPLINDLRSSRGALSFSPSQLFSPDTNIDTKFIDASLSDTLLSGLTEEEKKKKILEFHSIFQSSLIQWIRKNQDKTPLQNLSDLSLKLSTLTDNYSLKKLLWVTGKTFLSIFNNEFAPSRDCSVFLAKVDNLIPWGASYITPEQNQEIEKTLQQILYFITLEAISAPSLEDVVDIFALEGLYFSENEVLDAQAVLSGKNEETLSLVAKGVIEELNKIRDGLDLYIRADQKNIDYVKKASAELDNLSSTLLLLSLDEEANLSKLGSEQLEGIILFVDKNPNDLSSVLNEMKSIASDLIVIEESVTRLSPATQGQDSVSASNIKIRIIEQLMVNLARAKHIVTVFAQPEGGSAESLEELSKLFSEVSSALMLINEIVASNAFKKLEDITQLIIKDPQIVSSKTQLENYANALASLEYYVEAVRDEQPDPHRMLASARQYLVDFDPSMDPDNQVKVSQVTPLAHSVEDLSTEVKIYQPTTSSSPAIVLFEDAKDIIIDDEIKDIFLEELAGEIESIQDILNSALVPLSKEELRDLRKSFHTIKGSGRMIQATALGDVAYHGEMIFNKILEGQREYRPIIKSFAEKANEMFAQFHLSATTGQPLFWEQEKFLAWAKILASGGDVTYQDVSVLPPISSEEQSLENQNQELGVVQNFETNPEEVVVIEEPLHHIIEVEETSMQEDHKFLFQNPEDVENKMLDAPTSISSEFDQISDVGETQDHHFSFDQDVLTVDDTAHSVSPTPDMSHEKTFDFGDLSLEEIVDSETLPLLDVAAPAPTKIDVSDDISNERLPQSSLSEEELNEEFDSSVNLTQETSHVSWDFSDLSLEAVDDVKSPMGTTEESKVLPSPFVLDDSPTDQISLDLELEKNTVEHHEIVFPEIKEQKVDLVSFEIDNVTLDAVPEKDEDIPSLTSIDDVSQWNNSVDTGDEEIIGWTSVSKDKNIENEIEDLSFKYSDEPITNETVSPEVPHMPSTPEVIVVSPSPALNTPALNTKEGTIEEITPSSVLDLSPLPPNIPANSDWKEYLSLLVDYNNKMSEWLDATQKIEFLSVDNQKTLINNLMGYQKRESFLLTKTLERMSEVEALAIKNEIKKMLFPETTDNNKNEISPQSTPANPPHREVAQPPKSSTEVSSQIEKRPQVQQPQPKPQVPKAPQNFKVVPSPQPKKSWFSKIFSKK